MSMLQTVGYGAGVSISTQKCRLIAHAALSKGDCAAVSFATLDATSKLPTSTKAVATAGLEADVFVIALEDVGNGEQGLFAVSGVVEALVDSGVAAGELLCGTNAAADLADATAVTNAKMIGRALEAYSSSALSKVWFDGLNGLGHNET